VVAGGGNLVAGAVGATLLGGRNTLYGRRLAETLRVRGRRRLLTAHVAIAAAGRVRPRHRHARPYDDTALAHRRPP
jgi:hypothetical protein